MTSFNNLSIILLTASPVGVDESVSNFLPISPDRLTVGSIGMAPVRMEKTWAKQDESHAEIRRELLGETYVRKQLKQFGTGEEMKGRFRNWSWGRQGNRIGVELEIEMQISDIAVYSSLQYEIWKILT